MQGPPKSGASCAKPGTALVIFAQNDREGGHIRVKCYRETLQEGGDWRVFECRSSRRGKGGRDGGKGPPKCGFSCRQLPSVAESQASECDAPFLLSATQVLRDEYSY